MPGTDATVLVVFLICATIITVEALSRHRIIDQIKEEWTRNEHGRDNSTAEEPSHE